MQDIHTLGGGGGGGGGGRIFTAAGLTGVARRLQPQNPHNHLPLKCPRCDSQNTKFCYYNNYNLSQPRHFCKNCRRYWTKGGVLRNVPVGGGCRKSKRSSKAKSSVDTSTTSYTATDGDKKNVAAPTSHSSSESSSLCSRGAAKTKAIVEDFNEFQQLIETHQVSSITNMVGSSSGGELVGSNEGEKMMGSTTNEIARTGFIDHDHEVQVDPTAMEQESREGNSGLATLDWGNVGTLGHDDLVTGAPQPQPLLVNKNGGANGGEEDGLFDFGGVDEGYWNQAQWVDDQSFNFLPQFQVMDFNLGKK